MEVILLDSDSKHVLTILGLVACFGAGYFVCRGENSVTLRTGEKFSVFASIENSIDGKAEMNFTDEKKAIENAVDGYYTSADEYFDYFYDNGVVDTSDDETYEYSNKYQMFDSIAYINCGNFHFDGTQGFAHFFKDSPDTDGFIIDLRENLGGYTEYCMNTLAYFIEPRNIAKYYYFNGKTEDVEINFNNKRTDKKVVILVNENTASSGEIFMSAMVQFYDGEVTVVGTKTYGKGSFQNNEKISENESIKYTAGYYTVGDWQCYDGVGLSPDIEVPMQYDPDIICTDDDVQFQTALDLLK